jgi:hypothetical protein
MVVHLSCCGCTALLQKKRPQSSKAAELGGDFEDLGYLQRLGEYEAVIGEEPPTTTE